MKKAKRIYEIGLQIRELLNEDDSVTPEIEEPLDDFLDKIWWELTDEERANIKQGHWKKGKLNPSQLTALEKATMNYINGPASSPTSYT